MNMTNEQSRAQIQTRQSVSVIVSHKERMYVCVQTYARASTTHGMREDARYMEGIHTHTHTTPFLGMHSR